MLPNRDQRRIVEPSRQLDREDHVIESKIGWSGGRNRAAFGVDDDVVGVDANLFEHRTQKRRLVFAISVMASEDIGGGMRLLASDAEFDGNIANVILDEPGESLHLG